MNFETEEIEYRDIEIAMPRNQLVAALKLVRHEMGLPDTRIQASTMTKLQRCTSVRRVVTTFA